MSSLSARRCATHGKPNGCVPRLERLPPRTSLTILNWLADASLRNVAQLVSLPRAGNRKIDSGIPRVVRRNNAAVFRSAAQAVKHAVGGSRDSNDGIPSISFTAKIRRHHADDERPASSKDNPRIIAHAFELSRFVRNTKILGQFPRDVTLLVNAE